MHCRNAFKLAFFLLLLAALPVSRLAARILRYGTVNRKEEGGILGSLGNLLDGDGM